MTYRMMKTLLQIRVERLKIRNYNGIRQKDIRQDDRTGRENKRN